MYNSPRGYNWNPRLELTFALWVVVEAVGTSVTVETVKVFSAWTLSSSDLTHLVQCTIHTALAGDTARVVKVTHVTPGCSRDIP